MRAAAIPRIGGPGDDNTWLQTADLTADADIAQDEAFAIRVTAGSPGNLIFSGYQQQQPVLPYRQVFTGGSWAAAAIIPLLIPIGPGGVYSPIPGVDFVGAPNNVSAYNNAGATTRRGNRFDVRTVMTVYGAWVMRNGAANNGDFSVQLYDTNGTTVLASSGVIDGDVRAAVVGPCFAAFEDGPVTLGLGTGYRLAIVAESATNTAAFDFDVPAAAMLDMLPGRQAMHRSVYTSGNWVDTATSRTIMGLLIDVDSLDGSPTAGSPGAGGGGYRVAPALIGRGGLIG